ncbi:MAG: nucleoside triphosphate pyrophosphohydrolase [Pseudomonadota bacterium]|jgi:ATP diphosphatase
MTDTRSDSSLQRFLTIITKLRDPQKGCPWDREQTFQTLTSLLIEEAYEVNDAVAKGAREVQEELGDLMSLIGLFSEIAREQGLFSYDSVLDTISDKLVRRHPHVFGETKVADTKEVLRNWEAIKQSERAADKTDKDTKEQKGLLDGIPRSLPALLKAHQIGQRCARVGFDWGTQSGVADKINEELGEFLAEAKQPEQSNRAKVVEEFGDLLFTLAQYSRHLGINPEEALAAANDKFTRRFKSLERLASQRHGDTPLGQIGTEGLEQLWREVKDGERN